MSVNPSAPVGVERDPDRVVFLLPGRVYSTDRPLLHFAAAVFARHGWTTRPVSWPESSPQPDGADLPSWFARQRSFVHAHVSRLLDAETAPTIALAGKSMGAFAAMTAAERGLPGVWLTPVLRDSGMPDDLRRGTAPFLLAGGTADPCWDAGLVRRLGRPFHEAEGADHSMETGDPVHSAEILRRTTVAMDEFVAGL